MTPTAQQQHFLDALMGTTENLALVARAGCGKTSTILLGVDALAAAYPTAEISVCAYNKAIAAEVEQKLRQRGHTNWKTVQASTMHSLGFTLLKFTYQLTKESVDENKTRNLIAARKATLTLQAEQAAKADDTTQEHILLRSISTLNYYSSQVAALVTYAKQAAVGFFAEQPIEDPRTWHALADHYGLEGLESTTDASLVVAEAQVVYRQGLDITDIIDFDDMILLPLIKQLRVRFGKDYIFLDEAQDLSPARQALARKFLKAKTGRMIIVGDDRQAIYGFSGADADALPNLIKAYGAMVLPLSVTWRCPTSVVAEAQRLVPDIEAASDRRGSVEHVLQIDQSALKPDHDAILCRNTAPLIDIAYSLIRKGIAAKVEGREIGNGLKALARRWKVGTIAALYDRLTAYQDRETEKARAKGQDAKVEEINDRVNTLIEIAKACQQRNEQHVDAVINAIDRLFGDESKGDMRGAVTLATYHRSKGREWPRVWLFEHSTRCPSKAARQPWEQQQEANLAYVAITRAMDTLVFVGG